MQLDEIYRNFEIQMRLLIKQTTFDCRFFGDEKISTLLITLISSASRSRSSIVGGGGRFVLNTFTLFSFMSDSSMYFRLGS